MELGGGGGGSGGDYCVDAHADVSELDYHIHASLSTNCHLK